MRKILLFTMLAAFLSSCNSNKPKDSVKQENTITIQGKIKFPDDRFKMMIYRYKDYKKQIEDSFTVNDDGTYKYEMKVKEPGTYILDCQKWQIVSFWAEDEDLEINFRGQDTAKIKIKNPPYVHINGGKNNEVMNLLNYNNFRSYQLTIQLSQLIYKNLKGTDLYNTIFGESYKIINNDADARIKYIAEHYYDRNSVLAALSKLRESDSTFINKILADFKKVNPNYEPMLSFEKNRNEKIAKKRKVETGQPAPNFKYKTKEGKIVSLADYKGKYVLIDFWASWCGPCRKEIPNLKKAYKKYKDKNIEFLSVSIDKKENDWLKAIDEENMPWTQIRADDSGVQLMDDYQFSGIPFIILINKEGKFEAKYLRGKSLEQILDKILLSK